MRQRSPTGIVPLLLLVICLLSACSPTRQRFEAKIELPSEIEHPSTAFVLNPDTMNPSAAFHSVGAAGTLLFGQHAVTLRLPTMRQAPSPFSGLLETESPGVPRPAAPRVVRVEYVGAAADARITGEALLPGVVHYCLGQDPANWHIDLPTYGSILYEGLYPGIDLRYTGSKDALKGSYVVAPGADPAVIRWRYAGAAAVAIEQNEIVIQVDAEGEGLPIREHAPISWQEIDGQRVPVETHYLMRDDGSLGLALGRYDRGRELIIDPTLDYSSFVGGSGIDGAYGMAVDAEGNVYIGGTAEEVATVTSLTSTENLNAYVTKLDLSQTGAAQHVFTTYIGGNSLDLITSLGIDSRGNIGAAGYTESNDFATTPNAYQRAFGGFVDGFVLQLSATGAIQYASYLGGVELEEINDVAVSAGGLIYVAGFAGSNDYPTTPDAYQGTKTGYGVGAVASVVDPSLSGGDSLVYSTYLTGSKGAEGYAIGEADGLILLAGATDSETMPLKNAYQDTNRGGSGYQEGFVAVIDPSREGDEQIRYCTFLGGTGSDLIGAIAIDDEGMISVGGSTKSTDFPVSQGSPAHGGQNDAFLVKLDPSNGTMRYGTLAGGAGDDGYCDIALDAQGNVYAVGGAGSQGFPLVDPFQDTFKGGAASHERLEWLGPADAVAAQYDAAGVMTFGTFLSGSGFDMAMDVVLDGSGNVLVAGGTESSDFQTVSPYQATKGGVADAFVVRIGGLAEEPTPTPTATPEGVSLFLPVIQRLR